MSSQRFCLRWNNHQTNLLSVFDQLLHAETFTDVTLAVEGKYLKAHKMVLSACSPYFQSLFTTHPEKHPIVILKDVPYADMKSLLDFMYRGEVSVDQERLTAFLKVAESLRIKGLTEVSDEQNNLREQNLQNSSSTPPPQLHRIHPYYVQKKTQGMLLTNPLLGNALTMPKRKRGRPRKLSGSSNGTGDCEDYESNDIVQGSPEILEVRMGTEGFQSNSGNEGDSCKRGDNNENDDSQEEAMDTSDTNIKTSTPHPPSSKTKELSLRKEQENSTSEAASMGLLVPKSEPPDYHTTAQQSTDKTMMKIRMSSQYYVHQKLQQQLNSPATSSQSITSQSNFQQNLHTDSINNNSNSNNNNSLNSIINTTTNNNNLNNNILNPCDMSTNNMVTSTPNQRTTSINNNNNNDSQSNASIGSNSTNMLPPTSTIISINSTGNITTTAMTPGTRPPVKRRARRKANSSSPDDQTEHLTEMSVRGLNLFRYASISEGIYQCTECAKDNIQKTFKNKYSFQRHAFLYHEGTQRKVFPCPVCSKEFSRPDKMKNHMKTTHECYMPRDCVYPLNLLIGSGGEMLKMPKIDRITTNDTDMLKMPKIERIGTSVTHMINLPKIESVMSTTQ